MGVRGDLSNVEYNKICTLFRYELLTGNHNLLEDTIKVAFYNMTAEMDATQETYTTVGEIPSTGGYITGGFILTNPSLTTDNYDGWLWRADPLLIPLSTVTFGRMLLYNASKSNRALVTYKLAQEVSTFNSPLRIVPGIYPFENWLRI